MLSRTLPNALWGLGRHVRTASQITWQDSEEFFLHNCHHAGSHSVMTRSSEARTASYPQRPLILHAPEPTSNAILDIRSGETLRLDSLGPLVVNGDGSMSRISNWQQMTEVEQDTTYRRLRKRNQHRLQQLWTNEDRK